MSKQCAAGGLLRCDSSLIPTILNVLPVNQVFTTTPAGTTMDNKPFVNIPTFGMCTSPTHPGMRFSMGAPVPCLPNITTPWFTGAPNVQIGSAPALNEKSKCRCTYGGIISIAVAGQPFSDAGG